MGQVQQFGKPTFESDVWGILPEDRAATIAKKEIEGAQEYLAFRAAEEDMDARVARGLSAINFADVMSSDLAGTDASGLDQDFYNL